MAGAGGAAFDNAGAEHGGDRSGAAGSLSGESGSAGRGNGGTAGNGGRATQDGGSDNGGGANYGGRDGVGALGGLGGQSAGGTCAAEPCGAERVDLATSPEHCGDCERPCASDRVEERACSGGLCVSSCQAGWGNCYQPAGAAADDGCETHLTSEIYHCGECDRACVTTGAVDLVSCSAGRCVSTCRPGHANVVRPQAPAPDDGCEVDLKTSVDHCGAEGRACSSTNVGERECVDGLCTSTCADGHANIDHPAATEGDDGCEVDLSSNVDHCGAEGRACSSTNVDERECVDGLCVSSCIDGHANIGRPRRPTPDDGCEVDLGSNVDHCGAEGRACSSTNVDERECVDGLCVSSCAWGYANVNRPVGAIADDGCEASCPSAIGGPELVILPPGYCIDRTEVTQAQYQAWLEVAPAPTPDGQITQCSWNVSYIPILNWDPAARADHPVVDVDWCDAYAFCEGVGKRLCGGRDGRANPYGGDDAQSAASGQWYNACSSGGTYVYPYGNEYGGNLCNGADSNVDETLPVASVATCQGMLGSGYDGVFDLSGNVMEWEDSCDGASGGSDQCYVRGGTCLNSYDDKRLECANAKSHSRTFSNAFLGFRCCAP